MSKISREMYASTLRNLFWQAAEDVGPIDATQILTSLLQEFSAELAEISHEHGVVVTQPEQKI